MPQNNLRSTIRRLVWRIMPAPFFHLAFRNQLSGMGHEIESAGVVKAAQTMAEGVEGPCYRLDLANGTVIFSTAPTPNNIKITYRARRKLGLGAEYSKALVDTVVRYRYPHAMVPVLKIPVADQQRGGFHLQHRNLPQETDDFDAAERTFLQENFTPRAGWKVIDIGCYLGHGATQVAQLVGSTGRLLAVEAIPGNAAIATVQLAQNGLDQAQVLNRAIWKTAGEVVQMNVTENQANAIASNVINSSKKVDIKTTSIEELTNMVGGPADLVSLTVNGAEVEALDCLEAMPPDDRPLRMVMPGWYPADGLHRSDILQAKLKELSYVTLVTKHRFVIAWRPDLLL
ncbi:MAG: FkbM family methyltransferase [Pseudomonadota bacterium]